MANDVTNFTKIRLEGVVTNFLSNKFDDLAEFFTDEGCFNSFIDLFADGLREEKIEEWVWERMIEFENVQIDTSDTKRKLIRPAEQTKQGVADFITEETGKLGVLAKRLRELINVVSQEVRLTDGERIVGAAPLKDVNVIDFRPRKNI